MPNDARGEVNDARRLAGDVRRSVVVGGASSPTGWPTFHRVGEFAHLTNSCPCCRPRPVLCPAMRRRLFTFLSAISLLLLVATCVFWHRGKAAFERAFYEAESAGAPETFGVLNFNGTVQFEHVRNCPWSDIGPPFVSGRSGQWGWGRYDFATEADLSDWESAMSAFAVDLPLAGTPRVPPRNAWVIGYGREQLIGIVDGLRPQTHRSEWAIPSPPVPVVTFVRLPHWLIAITLGLSPGLWSATAIVRRIMRRTRVTAGRCLSCGYDLRASSGRCPECGTVPKKIPVIDRPTTGDPLTLTPPS
jgi:hypothetical protein